MSSNVVPFPLREASARCHPPADALAQVIEFPSPLDSLAAHDVDVLLSLVFSSGGEWLCETERDDTWHLAAIIGPTHPARSSYAAFVVYREAGKLHLIDARMIVRWRQLGVFDDVEALARTLAGLMHAASEPVAAKAPAVAAHRRSPSRRIPAASARPSRAAFRQSQDPPATH